MEGRGDAGDASQTEKNTGQFSKSLMNVWFYDKRQTFSNVTAFTYCVHGCTVVGHEEAWCDKRMLRIEVHI